jgi:flagellar hook-associated protein 3 FlgL
VTEIDSIRANLVSLANTQVQGKYIFAGTQTLGTAAHPLPFDDPTPTTGPIAYWGNTGSINLNVNSTTAVSTNISGDKVFFGSGGQGSSTDIFQAVTDLRNGLSTNNAVLIQKAATSLNTVLDNLNQVEAELGGRQAGLTSLSSTLSGFNVTLQGMQNTLQDTDYPKVATEFSQDQTVQSVTLSALAKTNKTNLFDFLG